MSAFAALHFNKKVDDGGSPCVDSSQRGSCGFDWQSSGGAVPTEKGVVDGRTCVMTKRHHFFVKALQQLLMERGVGLGAEKEDG